MNFTIARAIGYTFLLILVNFININWFHGSSEEFLALFILGAVVGEIGIPAVIPKLTELEYKLCHNSGNVAIQPPTPEPWRRIGLIAAAIGLFIFGLLMTSHAVIANHH